jgi:hypothetical protein
MPIWQRTIQCVKKKNVERRGIKKKIVEKRRLRLSSTIVLDDFFLDVFLWTSFLSTSSYFMMIIFFVNLCPSTTSW